jgi:hypothetical protein
MKKMVLILGVLVIVSDALDVISTYLATPDLAFEWNPLVREYGWGWEAIILLHVVADLIFLAWLAFFGKTKPAREDKPVEVNTFGRTIAWAAAGFTPRDRKIDLKRYLGFLGIVIPVGAIINAFCNTALNLSFYLEWFAGLNESTYGIYTIVKLIIILIGIILIVLLPMKKYYSN